MSGSQAGIKCLGNDTAIFFWSSCGASWADYKFPGNYSHINKNKYRCVVTKNRVYSKGVCSAPYSLRDPGEGPSHKAKLNSSYLRVMVKLKAKWYN